MTGDVVYRKTQIAWPTIAPLLITAAILVPTLRSAGIEAGPVIVAVVYGIILLLFATLTVTVTTDGVVASFGIGLIRKDVPFADVVSFARVRNHWIYGWGIHSYPGGTLYNASGLSAVEFRLSSGRYVAIGTAEPDALVNWLQQATGRQEAAHEPRTGRAWGPQHTFGVVVGVMAVAFAGVAVYVTMQPPTAIAGYDSLYVSNGWYRTETPYVEMQSVTLERVLPRVGLKVNGSGVGNTMRGNYRVDGWGTARLYINLDVPPFVVVVAGDRHLVVNFKDPAMTRKLYDDIRFHMAARGRG